jgi:hypothetical protein
MKMGDSAITAGSGVGEVGVNVEDALATKKAGRLNYS